MKSIATVLGTRPEIVKFSPLLPLFDREFKHTLIHTGQHYDENMDRVFFKELRLKSPKHFLNVGSGPQGAQTARMLERIEPILQKSKPDGVAVLGDTNSTLAGALVAAKLNIPVIHIEAGCRSFNWNMPEEKNRVMVDHISTLLFAPDKEAVSHLQKEGVSKSKIFEVGNTGLDATKRTIQIASDSRLRKFNASPGSYVMATIHRAENTDNQERLHGLIQALNDISELVPVLFPVHPRTVNVLKKHKLKLAPGVRQLPPIGNLDFIALLKNGLFILSDSGGVQEEAAVVNRPCLILREDTEWKRLVTSGKNFLVGIKHQNIVKVAKALIRSEKLRDQIRARKAPLNFGATQRVLKVLKAC